jgi:hypothetical protein
VAKSVVSRQGLSRRREPSVGGTLGVSQPTRRRRKETLVEREQQYVGIDLHRRRSVVVRMNDAGEVLAVSKIDNDPLALSMVIAEAGPDPEVALEACYGWYWAADLLQADGARVHLVHPLGLHWDGPTIRPVRPKLVNLWARSSLLTPSILCPVRRC